MDEILGTHMYAAAADTPGPGDDAPADHQR